MSVVVQAQVGGLLSDLSSSRRGERRALREREEFASLLQIERAETARLKVRGGGGLGGSG